MLFLPRGATARRLAICGCPSLARTSRERCVRLARPFHAETLVKVEHGTGVLGRHQRSVLEQPRRHGCRMETGSSTRERWRSTAPDANEPSYSSTVTQVRGVASVSEKIGWGALAP